MSPIPVTAAIGGALYAHQPVSTTCILDTNHFAVTMNLADWGTIPVAIPTGYGAWLDVSAKLFGGGTLNTGTAEHGGKMYGKVWFAGQFEIKAPSIKVPVAPGKFLHETGTFGFKGHLLAYTSNPMVNIPPPLFEYTIGGKGHFSVRMTPLGGNSLEVKSVLYSFVPF